MLEQLKDAFILADVDGNGKLDFDEFKAVFKMELNISEAKVSFVKLNMFHLRRAISLINICENRLAASCKCKANHMTLDVR